LAGLRGAVAAAALSFAALAVALAAAPGTPERLGASDRATAPDAGELPLAARAAIARVLGRDDAAYHVRPDGVGFALRTPRQGLQARFVAGRVEVRAGGSSLGFSLHAVGHGETLRGLAAVAPVARANRVEYRRGALVEWYANGPLGLEQGFTLKARSNRGDGPLTLAIRLSGNLHASLAPGRDGLAFAGSTLRYGGLFAADAAGRSLHAWLELRRRTLLLRVDDARARYPLTIDPFIEQAKLTASDGTAGDNLQTVAISGDTIAVGARAADIGANADQGAVYVFVKPAGGWASATETAKLTASGGAAGDHLGTAVAIDGDTIAVGANGAGVAAPGAVYVFVKPAGGWANTTETAKLTASAGFRFGNAVAIDGDTIVAGYENGPPFIRAAYVFVRPAGGWANATETAKLTASDGAAGDFFGSRSVAIDGDTIAVSAFTDDVGANVDQGSLYVFVRPAGGWANATETAKLIASNGAAGDFLGGFGPALAIEGDTVAAGAEHHDVGANADQGEVYVFVRPAGGWANMTETAQLTASDGVAGDFLGGAVAIAGDTVVAGAPFDDIGACCDQGSVYAFVKPASGWANMTETEKLTASTANAGDALGRNVAAAGDALVAGAPEYSSGLQGSAYVFVRIGRPRAKGPSAPPPGCSKRPPQAPTPPVCP
jgi:hypothetical protein